LVRKLKNIENETQTLYDLEYGEKHSKRCKMRNAHCRTWNMAIKQKNEKKERNSHDGIWKTERNTENVENEKHTF
jgi:ABC-type dipeptide/oligopeptide/nickel transport system ATPase component